MGIITSRCGEVNEGDGAGFHFIKTHSNIYLGMENSLPHYVLEII